MSRSFLLPATTILAALTALALLATAVALRPVPPVASGHAATAASRAAVLGFYEAVNAAIATDDFAPLAAVLAPDYAESDATGALVPGGAALEQSLRTLHEIAPTLRVDAADLVGDGDRVMAVVATSGAKQATALGLPLIASVLWSPIDVFRVADGRVAERVSVSGQRMLLERWVTAPLDLPLLSERVVTVQRLSFAPAATLSVPVFDGPRLLAVESGALVVAVAGTSPDAVAVAGASPDGDVTKLAAGDWLVVPTGAAYQAHNAGREQAVLLEVLATGTTAPPWVKASRTDGVTTRVLAGELFTSVPKGRAVLTTGRLTLAPGTRLAWAGPAGPTMLVVEAGMLELATAEASAWFRSAVSGVHRSGRSETLAAGDGARIGMGTGAEIRNAGDVPAEILVVTLIGEEGEPASAG